MASLLALSNGQLDGKHSPLAHGAGRLDGAVMQQHDLLDDGKPQSRAAGFPGTRLVHPVKTVEDVGQVLFWNADAGVADANRPPACPARSTSMFTLPPRGVYLMALSMTL